MTEPRSLSLSSKQDSTTVLNECGPLTKMRRLRIRALVTHGAVAMAVLAISNLLSIKTGCIHTQDTPPLHSASKAKLVTIATGPKKLHEIYDNVRTFVIFVGHSRSGHSIVGSLLDAHPEVIISNELIISNTWKLFRQNAEKKPNWIAKKRSFYFKIHQDSAFQATIGLRADKPPREGTNHSYNYHVHGQWQGQYRDEITVMGDKCGHFTAEYFRDLGNMVKLEHIQKNLGVSLKIIHVLRNPFDVLATRIMRETDGARDSASTEKKVENTKKLDDFITGYFGRTEAIARIRENYDVLDIPGHELVQRPKKTMQNLCDYVGITCEEDYIDACAGLLYGEPSITRNLIKWSNAEKRRIQKEINKYPFLKRYRFNSFP